jgi:hypothetical protein
MQEEFRKIQKREAAVNAGCEQSKARSFD